jgi:hypothetical protein
MSRRYPQTLSLLLQSFPAAFEGRHANPVRFTPSYGRFVFRTANILRCLAPSSSVGGF